MSMARKFDIRLKRVGDIPTGVRREIAVSELNFSAPYSDIATLDFTASMTVNGDIPVNAELKVEIKDASDNWSEPRSGRFIVTDRSFDEADSTLITNFTLVNYVAFVLSASALHSADGKDRVYNDSAGVALFHPISEALARGWGKSLIFNFDATRDSHDHRWSEDAELVEWPVPADQSILESLTLMSTQGLVEWTTQGRELVVLNVGSGLDHSGDTEIVIGNFASEIPIAESISELSTSVIVRDANGKPHVHNGTSHTDLGKLETAVTAGGIRGSNMLAKLGRLELLRGKKVTQLTITENIARVVSAPLVKYTLGDYVWLRRRRTGRNQKVRVHTVQVRKTADAQVSVDIMVLDRTADRTDRLTRRIASLGNKTRGSGRIGAGSGGGGGSAVAGQIVSNHTGGSPARVLIDGTTEPTAFLPSLSSYFPMAEDRVMVEIVGGVGQVIAGRIGGVAAPTAGTSEPLELSPGWVVWDEGTYGTPGVKRLASDWVLLSGVLVAQAGATALVLKLPGGYRPPRTAPLVFPVLIQDVSAFGAKAARGLVALDPATGALTTYGAVVPGSLISLGGIYWNVATDQIIVSSTGAVTGIDTNGIAWAAGRGGDGAKSFVVPPGRIPAAERTLNATLVNFRNMVFVDSSVGKLDTAGNLSTPGLSTEAAYHDGAWWDTASSAFLEWTVIPLINGFVHGAQPLEYTKTPDGLVLLRGATSSGVAGQTMGQLKEGSRPSAQILSSSGVRIAPSGAIISPSGGNAYRKLNTLFAAGR